jgi:hypothetical protein
MKTFFICSNSGSLLDLSNLTVTKKRLKGLITKQGADFVMVEAEIFPTEVTKIIEELDSYPVLNEEHYALTCKYYEIKLLFDDNSILNQLLFLAREEPDWDLRNIIEDAVYEYGTEFNAYILYRQEKAEGDSEEEIYEFVDSAGHPYLNIDKTKLVDLYEELIEFAEQESKSYFKEINFLGEKFYLEAALDYIGEEPYIINVEEKKE